MSKVMMCSCKHEFQDQQYGKGMCLFNGIGKDQKSGYRCTVCGKEVKNNDSPKKK